MSKESSIKWWEWIRKIFLWILGLSLLSGAVVVGINVFKQEEDIVKSDPSVAETSPQQVEVEKEDDPDPPVLDTSKEPEGPSEVVEVEEPVSETGLSVSELEEALMAEKAKNAELQAQVQTRQGEFGPPPTGPIGAATQSLIDEAKGVAPQVANPLDRVFMARRPETPPAREGLKEVPVGQRNFFLSPPLVEKAGGQLFAILMVARNNLPPKPIYLREGESAKMPNPTPGTDGQYRAVPSGLGDGMVAIVTEVTDIQQFNQFRQSMGWPD